MAVSHFRIDERQEAGRRRVELVGELDLAASPVLEARLGLLRAENTAVRLDLSKLEFIDSSGLHVLLRWTNEAREDGWALEIDPDVPAAVKRLFQLVGVERLLSGDGGRGSR